MGESSVAINARKVEETFGCLNPSVNASRGANV